MLSLEALPMENFIFTHVLLLGGGEGILSWLWTPIQIYFSLLVLDDGKEQAL